MRTPRLLTLLTLTLGLGLLPAAAQDAPAGAPGPQGAQRGPGRMEGRMEGRMAARLHLTEAQQAGIKALRTKHEAELAPRLKAVMAARKAFAEAARKPETPVADLKVLHQALADQSFELKMAHRSLRQEIRALLTPEQREQAAQMEGRALGMAMAHRARWRGRGPAGAPSPVPAAQ